MGNSLLTNDVISKECLMALKNNLVFTRNVNREYGKEFAKTGAKIGNSFNARKPTRYEVTEGATLVVQDSADQFVPITLDKHYHVGMAFSQVDRTLSIDRFRERYIDQAMLALANKIDSAFYADMYKKVFSSVGVPSATALPSTLRGFTQAKAKMELLGAPKGMYSAIVDPLVQAEMVDGLKGLFQSSEKIADQYETGTMGIAAGSKFASSANVAKHTIGVLGGTPAVKTTISAQGATVIAVDGGSGSVVGYLKAGDVITIGTIMALNPQTRQSTGQLAQFVVTADTDMVTNEIASLPISPAIRTTGAYANCSALPQDGDLIKIFGHASAYTGVVASQNLVFHKNAFTMAVADLELPSDGANASRAVDEDAGLSLVMTSQFDITNYRNVTRIDFLGGWKCIYEELACRVVGQPA